jgi:hypothetical protein
MTSRKRIGHLGRTFPVESSQFSKSLIRTLCSTCGWLMVTTTLVGPRLGASLHSSSRKTLQCLSDGLVTGSDLDRMLTPWASQHETLHVRTAIRRRSLAVQSNQNASQAHSESAGARSAAGGKDSATGVSGAVKIYADEGLWKLRVRDGVTASVS